MRRLLSIIVAAAVAAVFKQLLNIIKLITRKKYGTGKIGKIVIYFGLITHLPYIQTILHFQTIQSGIFFLQSNLEMVYNAAWSFIYLPHCIVQSIPLSMFCSSCNEIRLKKVFCVKE